MSSIRVEALSLEYRTRAACLAKSLKLPFAGETDLCAKPEAKFALQVGERGLHFAAISGEDTDFSGPIRVDFVSGGAAYRRRYGGGAHQMIAKAVGLKPGIRPSVLDATAGLGRDAFVLASLGCTLTLVECQPIVAVLLEDGWKRALEASETAPIIARMRLICADAISLMRTWRNVPPQVVYLDPMFPPRVKTAQVKKEMRLFRSLANEDDSPDLLEAALALASNRVVVKRPRKASPIAGTSPKYAMEGRSSRFDIYPMKAFSKTGLVAHKETKQGRAPTNSS
ncbi:MAG: class I SAM-dependent methyltransferase, partial [Candidatus Accumulibacter sp.]|nr:class I SAM-dependent methyltransferase [Accumulibacter sp.]